MPKPSLSEIYSLPDALLQDNFEIVFTSVPDVLNGQDIRNMRLQCFSTSAPGRTLETAPVNLYGFEVHFGGRNTTSHTWSTTFIETRNFSILRPFTRWMELVRSSRTGHGVSKIYYAGRAEITLLSEAGLPVARAELINVFPETSPELQNDGSASSVIQLPVTFKFDEWQYLYDGGAAPSNIPGGVGSA